MSGRVDSDLFVMDSDSEGLEEARGATRILIDKQYYSGESLNEDDIARHLCNHRLVIVIAGLGFPTSTAAREVCKILKSRGTPCIAIAFLPAYLRDGVLENICHIHDGISASCGVVQVPLREFVDKSTHWPRRETVHRKADEYVLDCVRAIERIMGEGALTIDIADLMDFAKSASMISCGTARMKKTGNAQGAFFKIRQRMKRSYDKYLKRVSALVHVAGKDVPLKVVKELSEQIESEFGPECSIMLGTGTNRSDELVITLMTASEVKENQDDMKAEHTDEGVESRERKPARNPSCSFCGANKSEVRTLVAGPDVHICDSCVKMCVEVIDESRMRKSSKKYDEAKCTSGNKTSRFYTTMIGDEEAIRLMKDKVLEILDEGSVDHETVFLDRLAYLDKIFTYNFNRGPRCWIGER